MRWPVELGLLLGVAALAVHVDISVARINSGIMWLSVLLPWTVALLWLKRLFGLSPRARGGRAARPQAPADTETDPPCSSSSNDGWVLPVSSECPYIEKIEGVYRRGDDEHILACYCIINSLMIPAHICVCNLKVNACVMIG
jgi:hypothetical protein